MEETIFYRFEFTVISTIRPMIMLTACPLCLAVGTVAIKAMIDEIPIFMFLAIQLFGSVSLLWTIVFLKGIKYKSGESTVSLFIVGLIIGIGSIFTVFSLKYVSASQAGLVFSSQPALILFFAWLILKENTKAIFIILAITSMIGVIITINQKGVSDNLILGSLFAFLSTLAAAIYSVWMRIITDKQDPLISLATIQTVALVIAVVLMVYEDPLFSHSQRYTQIELFDLFRTYLIGMIHYGAAFLFYLLGLKEIRAGIAGLYLNLIPIFTIALAFQFLGEEFTRMQWLGALITITSVMLISVIVARGSEAARFADSAKSKG